MNGENNLCSLTDGNLHITNLFKLSKGVNLTFEMLVKLSEASRFLNNLLPFVFDKRSATVVGIRVNSSAELLVIAIGISLNY